MPQGAATKTQRYRKADTYARLNGQWKLTSNAEIFGRPERKVAKVDPSLYNRYAGTYEAIMNGKMVRTRFWRDGSKFMGQTEDQSGGELLPESETVLFDADDPEEGLADNIFVIDASGRAVEYVYRDGDIEYRSKRMK